MQAGKLDRRIRIEQASEVRSASGARTLDWSPPAVVVVVWASKEPLSGREAIQAQTTQAKIDTRFRVRYSPAVAAVTPDEKWRIVCAARAYNITSILELGRREGFEILAWARADQ
jgi:SPP1 family predicted phage head-tail adaptor